MHILSLDRPDGARVVDQRSSAIGAAGFSSRSFHENRVVALNSASILRPGGLQVPGSQTKNVRGKSIMGVCESRGHGLRDPMAPLRQGGCFNDPMSNDTPSTENMQDFNRQVIDEFRSNDDGKVGGSFEGSSVLLLHTTGAKSGEERVHPMVYQDLDGAVAVFASKAGADTNPACYHNLVANPGVTAEIGAETREFNARTAAGSERERIWEKQKADAPGFAEYEAKTEREIPVVILDPID